ncbi:MAG TPA: NAD(+)/NADH kinase [Thermoleophilaceae bacterium]|nr:NAD(+)/NADH kinase [Thermoleophilaceae bacterium]
MADHPRPSRLALVVHPTRPLDKPLAIVRGWAAETGLEVVQLPVVSGPKREVAPLGELQPGDFIVALGGDGTVLAALHAAAALDAPVLGVACGSLGALAAIKGDEIDAALERLQYGDWTPRRLPALKIEPDEGQTEWALNDFVVVRRSTGQLVASISIDDELYVRSAGDGVIVSTPLGSSAYSMGAGGPLLSAGTAAYLYTPLAMHGGNAPPLVVPATSKLRVQVYPNFAGFDVEIDGHTRAMPALDYRLSFHPDKVTLVSFGAHGHGITRLRERRLIADSPRILARDDRAAHPGS